MCVRVCVYVCVRVVVCEGSGRREEVAQGPLLYSMVLLFSVVGGWRWSMAGNKSLKAII